MFSFATCLPSPAAGSETKRAGTKVANKGSVSTESGKKALQESLDKFGKVGTADDEGGQKGRGSTGTKRKAETVEEKAAKEVQKTIKELLDPNYAKFCFGI